MKKLMTRALLPAVAAIMLWLAIFSPHPGPVLAQNGPRARPNRGGISRFPQQLDSI
jgi:hypothetical protein